MPVRVAADDGIAVVTIDREEALNGIWLLADILTELKKIRRLLEYGEEEDLGE